jgi:hypothetical protein
MHRACNLLNEILYHIMVWAVFDEGYNPWISLEHINSLHNKRTGYLKKCTLRDRMEYLPYLSTEDSSWRESHCELLWYKMLLSITVFSQMEAWCILYFNAQKKCRFWIAVGFKSASELLVQEICAQFVRRGKYSKLLCESSSERLMCSSMGCLKHSADFNRS